MSIGEKSASEVEELKSSLGKQVLCKDGSGVPHAGKVLHHELVYSFCWMGHVNLSLALFEVGLEKP